MSKMNIVEQSIASINKIIEAIESKTNLILSDLPTDKTALVIVDMINGFAKEGMLHSPRVNNLIPEIVALSKKSDAMHIKKIAFADAHTSRSPEFDAYPQHCLCGTSESEIVDEIKEVGGYKLILKNSTNGFLEEEFQQWLKENEEIDHYIVVGDCTDICIQQFAITLKTWFNKQDKKSRIIIPVNAVNTYDLDMHNGDLMQVMSLYTMLLNGIEIVKEII